jgi:hypothetical protein
MAAAVRSPDSAGERVKRLSLLDPVNLRKTSVYRNPADISLLNIVVGDYSSVLLPCTPITRDGRLQHASDRPMQMITGVAVDGKPVTSGYAAHPAFQDETGQSIACVIFEQPPSGRVSISGKGAIKSSGELIENPADFLEFLFLDVQGYDESAIDTGELADCYIACLREDIKVAYLLDSDAVLKTIVDDLALNIHAHSLLSHGKSVVRLRSRSSVDPVRYKFKDDGTDKMGLSITSEDIVNQITINYAYEPETTKYRSSITKHNPRSKGIYGGVFPGVLNLKGIQSTRQADGIADAYLRTHSIPALICSLTDDLRSSLVEAGDRVEITHPDGIGENGFVDAPGVVIQLDEGDADIKYGVAMDTDDDLFVSELVALTETAAAGKLGVDVQYSDGVATLTVLVLPDAEKVSGYSRESTWVNPYYRSTGGNTVLSGVDVTVNGIRRISDAQGQVAFSIGRGTYQAVISAAGYPSQELVFTV